MISLDKVRQHGEWPALRAKTEAQVMEVLDSIPKERVELQVKTIDEMQYNGYVRRRINYFVDPWERVTAWLFVPDGRDELPAIICCHDAVPQGKDEPAGIDGDPFMALALRYAEKGFVTLAPDSITAGDRASNSLGAFDTRGFYKDHPKMSAVGKMLSDHMHAVDALCDVKRVDAARIGVIGHGFGAVNSLFLAAFDERVQTCVASSGITRFNDDKDADRWSREKGFVFFPKLKNAIKQKDFTFDWEHILALIAPSPTLLLTADNNPDLPNTSSCTKAVKQAGNIYSLLGASGALQQYTHSGGHQPTLDALEAADDWFDRWL